MGKSFVRFEDEHLVDYFWVGGALVVVPVAIVLYRLLSSLCQPQDNANAPEAEEQESSFRRREGAYSGFLRINSRMSERVALWLTTSIYGSLWVRRFSARLTLPFHS